MFWTKDKDRGSRGDGDDNFLHRLDEVWEGVRGGGGHSHFFLCTQVSKRRNYQSACYCGKRKYTGHLSAISSRCLIHTPFSHALLKCCSGYSDHTEYAHAHVKVMRECLSSVCV